VHNNSIMNIAKLTPAVVLNLASSSGATG